MQRSQDKRDSGRAMAPLSRPVALAAGLALAFSLAGAEQAGAQSSTPAPAGRTRIPTPSISVVPETADVAPGGKLTLLATPHGGEAMLFSVKWRVREGRRGGRVEAEPDQRADGAYVATYTAPSSGHGQFHVDVRMPEYRGAFATTTVTIATPR